MNLTKNELEVAAKILWEEAFAADPHGTEELTRAPLKNKVNDSPSFVFVWSNLSTRELHALRCAMYPTVLEIRG